MTAAINTSDDRPDRQRVNHKRTARLIRQMELFGYTRRRRVKTTVAAKRAPRFPDLLKRRFAAEKPNTALTSAISLPADCGRGEYVPGSGVIDCYSRQLTGFTTADHMRTELVEEALPMTRSVRGALQGAIFHSDHGSCLYL